MIYGAIQALPPCWADRFDRRVDEYHEKLSVALAAEDVTDEEAAAMLSIVKAESGACIGPQDHYTHSGGYSAFQLEHKAHKYPGPFIGLSYEPIHNAAHAAVDVWRHSYGCGNDIAGRFSVYAGGGRCGKQWASLKERVNTYYYLLSVIRKQERETVP